MTSHYDHPLRLSVLNQNQFTSSGPKYHRSLFIFRNGPDLVGQKANLHKFDIDNLLLLKLQIPIDYQTVRSGRNKPIFPRMHGINGPLMGRNYIREGTGFPNVKLAFEGPGNYRLGQKSDAQNRLAGVIAPTLALFYF